VFDYIIANTPQSNSRRRSPKQPRRLTTEAWARIRDQVNREHRVLAAADPRSPRIKPTLAPMGWVR